MVNHVILLSSSYSLGKRIALHYTCEQSSSELPRSKEFFSQIQKDVDKIKEVCGKDTSLGSHCFKTHSNTWQSVLDNDCYFEGVLVVDNLDEFIALIKADRTASGVDVARYILSKVECTHLQLQNLVYLCYSNYHENKNDTLFQDTFYTNEYGTITESVYNKYKQANSPEVDDTTLLESTQNIHLPLRSRIMFTSNGTSKAISIDKTIAKHSSATAIE